MTTLSDSSFRPPLARDLSLKTWLAALKLLSALLVALGLGGIALVLSGRPLAGGGHPEPASLVLASLFCVGMALDQWRRWQVGRLARRGWELLATGRPEAAIRALDIAATDCTGTSRARSLHGLTLAWLRQGDYERALALSERTARARKGASATLRLAQAPALRATVLALYGELDEARRQVREIQRPLFDKTDYALLAQAVVLCREGRYVDAVKRIQHASREHVPELDVDAVAVVHAFARGQLGGLLVPLKPGCVLPEKPARGSEHEYLALEWPELAAWLRGEALAPRVLRCSPG
jgi:tetratricopeptide (TPR) repeat protein